MVKEKSRKLKNYFSSPREGLIKISQVELSQLNDKLDIINKNILYITYKVDKISVNQQMIDSKEYYDNKIPVQGSMDPED